MAANNDCGVRVYDMEKFQQMNHFRFPWPVNVSFLRAFAANFCSLLFAFFFFFEPGNSVIYHKTICVVLKPYIQMYSQFHFTMTRLS